MKTGTCRCGIRIFFNNSLCLSCGAIVGRCIPCGALNSSADDSAASTCDACETSVYPCVNRKHGVCHSFVSEANSLCRWCSFTKVVPPLNQPESVGRWAAMELAKRRLLVQLEDLQLPPFANNLMEAHPLAFQFLDDLLSNSGQPSSITTGHESGLITINLAEADSVHRERLRVELGEPHRTLIGHMRHEVGHYIDWAWASRVAADDYRRLFGDPGALVYNRAMTRYYQQGPPADWADRHVSAYAAMHPWEDFAETVNVYLDITAIATTANELSGRCLVLTPNADPQQLVAAVLKIVIEVSEYNFDLGSAPLLPERLPPAVVDKLAYVHGLRSKTSQNAG
jgi:hypothetical protein